MNNYGDDGIELRILPGVDLALWLRILTILLAAIAVGIIVVAMA